MSKAPYARALASSPIGMDMLFLLPGLRGLWAMSNYDNNRAVYDLAQGFNLTAANTPIFGASDFMGYAEYNGTDESHYNTSAELRTQFFMSAFAFAYFDGTASAVEAMCSKWNPTGNQKMWCLSRIATGEIQALISDDGTTEYAATTVGQVGAGVWAYCGFSYAISTSLEVYLGQLGGGADGQLESVTNTTAIPASLKASTSWFVVGAHASGPAATAFLDGRIGICGVAGLAWSDNVHNLLYKQLRQLLRV